MVRGWGALWLMGWLLCAGSVICEAQVVASAEAKTVHAPSAQASHCQHLIAQFDVAWPTHQKAQQAARGHKSRDVGETQCNAGHYTEGIRTLRHALHDIGVKAVRTTPAVPR